MEKLRIVFMGTPEFAVGILSTLLEKKYNVVGVITAPDKPAGRGQKTKFSAVKEFALSHHLNILQPTNLKDTHFLEELQALQANLQIIVAFRMLPELVWSMPKYGTFNLHASLLPNYRGAAPINWAIINGETKTGVTTFFIDEKIDTGAIILKKETNIDANENAGILHDRLLELGKTAVVETLELIKNNAIKTTIQPNSEEFKTAYKLNKENCKINWNKTGVEIHNLIRGLAPYPAAWCFIKNKEEEWNVKIYEAEFLPENHNFAIGKLISTKKEIKIAIQNGYIKLNSLQFPGKKRLTAAEICNGFQFSEETMAL